MFDQLQATQARYEEISQMLTQPQVVSDNQKYRELMKEYAALGPIVEKYREYAQAKEAAEEARQLLEEGGLERDFREMVENELRENREKAEIAAEELKILLLPGTPTTAKT